MTEAIYLEVTEKAEAARKVKRRVSVSGMLKILGVSRSGYSAWLKHAPSNAEKRRESVKAKIKDIYYESKQNYGAPKITQVLRKTGETISERTILFFQKNYFCHVQAAFAASSCVSILPISLNSCTQKLASPAFLPFPDHAAWYTLNHDVP